MVGVRVAFDQPGLLEAVGDLMHRLRGHERTPRQLRAGQGRAMAIEHTQGRELKRRQAVLSRHLGDRIENEMLQSGDGIGDPRLDARGCLTIDVVVHRGIVPWR